MKKLRKTLDDYDIPKFVKNYRMPCGDRLEITLKAGYDDSPTAIGGGVVLQFYANYGKHIGGWGISIRADAEVDGERWIGYPKLFNHTDRVIEAFNIFLTGFSKDFQEYVRHYEDDEYDESTKKFGRKFKESVDEDDDYARFVMGDLTDSIEKYLKSNKDELDLESVEQVRDYNTALLLTFNTGHKIKISFDDELD